MSRIKELIADLMEEPETLKPWNAIDVMLSRDTAVMSLRETITNELDDEE